RRVTAASHERRRLPTLGPVETLGLGGRMPDSAASPLELPASCYAFDHKGGVWTFVDDPGVLRRVDLKTGHVDRFGKVLPLRDVKAIAPTPAGDHVMLVAAEACASIRDPFGEAEVEVLGVEGIAAASF